MRAIPDTAEAIDAAWLEQALAKRFRGVRVAEVEVVEQHEATNAHARLRVAYEEPAGAPERMFCKMLPTDPGRRAAIAATGMGPREARFYERLAPQIAMRIPAVYVARHDPADGAFVLLIEDLAASGCTVSDGTVGVRVDSAAVALEHLADLHLRFEDASQRREHAAWVQGPLHDPRYASDMLRHGLDHHRDRLGEPFAQIALCYLDHADTLHALWQEGPTTVIHGDPHLGNVFDDHGLTGFLDWGIISTGTPLRDVSYFLAMSLDIEDRRAHERDLLRHYLEVRNATTDTPIDHETAWQTHRLHAAYCVIASCQIVTFPPNQSPARELFSNAFLARAKAAITDLDSLSALKHHGLA